MSGFSADWLALREPVDHRSRNRDVADTLHAQFALRDDVHALDLGCGTGSNLRGTYDLLPNKQHWTLVDYDLDLLTAAKTELLRWADDHVDDTGTLKLIKQGKTVRVSFKQADLAKNLSDVLQNKADLVTASALFDLASADTLRKLTKAVTRNRSVFYTVLTYNGVQKWTPRHPADNAMVAAYHSHQRTDKGFGEALGPTASQVLHDQFKASGYHVHEGDSPWVLVSPGDKDLIDEMVSGYANALDETSRVDPKDLKRWSERDFSGAVVGHTDTLAIPGYSTFHDDPEDED